MRRFWRWLIWSAAILVVLGLGVAGWLAWDRVSGRRAWEGYRAAALARGERLTFAEFRPPAVAPGENYVTGTIFERHGSVPSGGTGAERPLKLPDAPQSRTKASAAEQRMSDALGGMRAAGWLQEMEVPAEMGRGVLLGLERFKTELAELRAARGKPRNRFPQSEKLPPFTEFSALTLAMDVTAIWALRMDAHLAVGEPSEAREDLLDGLRLYEAATTEPTMISGLVRQAILTSILRAADGGIAGRHWRDADLAVLIAELGRIDLAADARHTFSSERGFVNDASERLRDESLRIQAQRTAEWDYSEREPRGGRLWWKLASGEPWRDQVSSNEILDRAISELTGGFAFAFAPASAANDVHFAEVTEMIAQRYAALEMAVRQTRIAAALERCRLQRGAFPETLDALVPEFLAALPQDVIGGQPVRYRRESPDRFQLYSIGANAQDDGGHAEIQQAMRGPFKAKDWVWGKPWK